MWGLWDDCRFSARRLAKNPWLTVAAVVSLAAAIGLNLAFFGLFHAILFEAPNVKAPAQLMAIYGRDKVRPYQSISYSDYVTISSQQKAFSGLSAYVRIPAQIGPVEPKADLLGEMTSSNYFDVLGMKPLAGRFFLPSEASPGHPVVVISAKLWRHQFHSLGDLSSQVLWINGVPFSIIGVAPDGFGGVVLDWGGEAPAFWVPFAMHSTLMPSSVDLLTSPDEQVTLLVGRLGEHSNVQAADSNLQAIAKQLAQTHSEPTFGFSVIPLSQARFWPAFRQAIQRKLNTLLALTCCVLLIASANVASLIIAKGATRRTEMSIRFALGAQTSVLVRQLLIEGLLLAGVGGVLGIGLCWSCLRLMDSLRILFPIPLNLHIEMHATTVIFGLAVAVASGLFIGLLSCTLVLITRTDSTLNLSQRSMSSDMKQSGWLSAAVCVQLALSCGVAYTTVLLGCSLWNEHSVDRGFHTEDVSSFSVLLPFDRTSEKLTTDGFNKLSANFDNAPFIESHAFKNDAVQRDVQIKSGFRGGYQASVRAISVSSSYFSTLRIRILAGHSLSSVQAESANQVVVGKDTASHLGRGEYPIGQTIYIGEDKNPKEIVGVVSDVLNGTEETPLPTIYTSVWSDPSRVQMLFVRSRLSTENLTPLIQQSLSTAIPGVHILKSESLDATVERAIEPLKVMSILVAIFGTFSMLLACIGVYALVSAEAQAKRRATGIRLALGSTRRGVLRLFLLSALRLCAVGCVAGTLLSILLASLVREWLWHMNRINAVSLLSVVAAMTLVTASAAFFPALSASKSDPTVLLRAD